MLKFGTTITPEVEQKLADLRTKKNLTAVSADLEGSPLGALPDHVFGFTYSPINESTPLYANRTFQGFEVHKLPHGIVHVIGFVTDSETLQIYEGKTPVDVRLYPEPFGESSRLIEIPLERIVRGKPLSRSEGNHMALHLDPAL